MIGVFCAVVVGILTGIVVFLVTDQPTTSQVAAVVAAAVGIAIGRPGAARRMARFGASMASEFPKPESVRPAAVEAQELPRGVRLPA
jgi:hypothetical protein